MDIRPGMMALRVMDIRPGMMAFDVVVFAGDVGGGASLKHDV
jgi:hypothetical protein